MHERMGNPETKDRIDIVHTASEDMAADIYTKAFGNYEKFKAVRDNITVILPKELDKIVEYRAARHAVLFGASEMGHEGFFSKQNSL